MDFLFGRYSEIVAKIASKFPKSLYELQKHHRLVQFLKFVVCYKCNAIYEFTECVEQVGSQRVAKKCMTSPYPNARDQARCNTPLVKIVELGNGKKVLKPYKTYCYNSLFSSLQYLLQLEGFAKLAEGWKIHKSSDVLRDIYDGQIWKDFMSVNGVPFLSEQFCYALALNIDWFQPYKLTESSVGAIYLTVLNLPRSIRYKREYIILLGIIPGPSEPKRNVNSFLRPLVNELLDFWKGMPMHVHGYDVRQTIRCALLCVSSDMPASRKACGFLSHVATLGCSKCKKPFPGGFGNKDYSGFDIRNWPERNLADHRKSVNLILKAKTKTERDQLEGMYGCRYTVLLDLPYFDPIRMTVVDPMHNLFLGSAKHILKKIWINKGIIITQNYDSIQKKMNSFKSPVDVGRIPRKIETGFAGFTADQFKNWTIFFSIPCLKEILPNDDLECWRHFVLASRILCQHTLTKSDIDLADALLTQFCRRIERMYGKTAITPNMHMHCHYKNMLLDYGPVYSFWCFSYERYNGILGSQPNNNRSIETQLMDRFLQDNSAFCLSHPTMFSDEFTPMCMPKQRLTGSVFETMNDMSTSFDVPKRFTRSTLDETDKESLKELIGKINNCSSSSISVNSISCKYTSIVLDGQAFSITKSGSCIALAEWDSDLFGIVPLSGEHVRPVYLKSFLKVFYTIDTASVDKIQSSFFGKVLWHSSHPMYSYFGKPVQVWCNDLFEIHVPSFVPISLLKRRCVNSVVNICNENVLLVVPLLNSVNKT